MPLSIDSPLRIETRCSLLMTVPTIEQDPKWWSCSPRSGTTALNAIWKAFWCLPSAGATATVVCRWLPLDFSLPSSSDEKKRLCGGRKTLDKRGYTYLRHKEAIAQARTADQCSGEHCLRASGALSAHGDCCFMMPVTVTVSVLVKHIDVIGIIKIHLKSFTAAKATKGTWRPSSTSWKNAGVEPRFWPA